MLPTYGTLLVKLLRMIMETCANVVSLRSSPSVLRMSELSKENKEQWGYLDGTLDRTRDKKE